MKHGLPVNPIRAAFLSPEMTMFSQREIVTEDSHPLQCRRKFSSCTKAGLRVFLYCPYPNDQIEQIDPARAFGAEGIISYGENSPDAAGENCVSFV
jgi:hypothetical protein